MYIIRYGTVFKCCATNRKVAVSIPDATLPPSCAVVMKSGNLNFLEPSGPLQACNGTVLPFTTKFHLHPYASKVQKCQYMPAYCKSLSHKLTYKTI